MRKKGPWLRAEKVGRVCLNASQSIVLVAKTLIKNENRVSCDGSDLELIRKQLINSFQRKLYAGGDPVKGPFMGSNGRFLDACPSAERRPSDKPNW